MKYFFLSALIILLCSSVMAKDFINVDSRTVAKFEDIPLEMLESASLIRLMFRHASVGTTINDGLNCVQGTSTNPDECREFPEYKYDRRNWIFQPRGNSGWKGKIDDFVEETQNQINDFDAFAFKYCYLEGLDNLMEPCGSAFSEEKMLSSWNYLRDKMEMLEEMYPSKIFIWWTIPLTQSGQYCTERLNALIREYCSENGKILFDIANIEAVAPDGTLSTNSNGWEIAYKGYCGEQKPDAQACHPNWIGKLLLAKAHWYMMARIAGWDDGTSVETMAANSFDIKVFPNPVPVAAQITVLLPAPTYLKLELIDALGRSLLAIENNGFHNKGKHNFDLNGSGFPRGMYFLKAGTNFGVRILPLIIE